MKSTSFSPNVSARVTAAFEAIKQSIQGDVFNDSLTRMLYASDASMYQKLPLAVIYPKTEQDCIEICKISDEYDVPLIARGAGTSLAGQVVGEAFIVDTSRYMTNILEVDAEEKFAIVEPGVVVSVLNQHVGHHNIMFAPDPSTLTRANISGLIGNNAWGAHSSLYGETVDNIIAMRLVTASGKLVEIKSLSELELDEKTKSPDHEGEMYRIVFNGVDKHRALIAQTYPPKDVPNNVGYALDKLLRRQPWDKNGQPFSLIPLICGSEGTLGIITQVTVKLVPKLKNRSLVIVHFSSLREALNVVAAANQHKAIAVELLDNFLLSIISHSNLKAKSQQWLDDSAKAILLIEFQNDDRKLSRDRAKEFIKYLEESTIGYKFSVLNEAQLENAWETRRAALGLLMGLKGDRKAVTFIEDSSVPVEALSEFVDGVEQVMNRFNIQCVYYGSVSRGLVHLRPMLNLREKIDQDKLQEITLNVIALLKKYRGSLSAKHGDGRARGGFIRYQLGDEIYTVLRKIKLAFDPKDNLNPGKLFDTPAMNTDLRVIAFHDKNTMVEEYFDWSADGGLAAAVEKCNGAGVCRRQAGTGAMCPSYQATYDEKHVTRGRANIFRQSLAMADGEEGLVSDELHEVLKFCVSCKACKTDCPAGVDMARLKSEHLQHYYKKHRLPLMSTLFKNIEKISAVAIYFPKTSRWLLSLGNVKKLLNIHQERQLPQYSNERLSLWFKKHVKQNKISKLGKIVIYNDVFTEFFQSNIAMKAIVSLEKLGYQVILSPLFPSLRIAISHGLIGEARRRLNESIEWLYDKANKNIPIIGLEPSELLTYRDEAEALVLDEISKNKVATIAKSTMLIEEFILIHAEIHERPAYVWPTASKSIKVHTHCHEKSIVGTRPLEEFLSTISDADVEMIQSGCCGMAGFFGYDKDNFDVSMKMGEISLFPAIKNSDAIIVAPGFSCRHQISDGTNKTALHPAEFLYQALFGA